MQYSCVWGNSVPTILLLMQRHLYGQGGLQAEGIFRINAENSQEEVVRDQLNRGLIPDGIDVHCLAGLIKAWFRELPSGVLDSLSPEQVMQCQTEEECTELVRRLPHTEGALLEWAINLMADVVEQEHLNKMNARNIAMVFAPNMTQMADPLTALMYAVQVMNFLKMLILRMLREREDSIVKPTLASRLEPFHENSHQSPQFHTENSENDNDYKQQSFVFEKPVVENSLNSGLEILNADREGHNLSSFQKESSIRDQSYELTNVQVHEHSSHSDGSKVKSPKVSDHAFGGKSRVGSQVIHLSRKFLPDFLHGLLHEEIICGLHKDTNELYQGMYASYKCHYIVLNRHQGNGIEKLQLSFRDMISFKLKMIIVCSLKEKG